MSRPSVVIIVVNWNGQKDTIECLHSLALLNRDRYDVISLVVDNASNDNSVAVLEKMFPKLVLIPLTTNRGFTGANNVGMQWALDHDKDFVWILNNDTFVDPDALSLFDAFSDSKVGATGSKIYFAAGHEYHKKRYKNSDRGKVLWYAGGIIDWANVYPSHRGVDEVDYSQYNKIEKTDFVTGCSMGLSSKIIKKVGMFDDRYFAYFEDLDLSIRIQRYGFKTMYVPTSIVWHVNASSSEGAGSPMHQYFQTRNRLLLGMRYGSTRTKFALVRQAVHQLRGGTLVEKKAVRDASSGRFGAYND